MNAEERARLRRESAKYTRFSRRTVLALLDALDAAEAERGKLKAMLASLTDYATYSDSYGVIGSEFHCCNFCHAGGAPNIAFKHDPHCPVIKCEAWAEEHYREARETDEALAQAEADRNAAMADANRWAASLTQTEARVKELEAELDALKESHLYRIPPDFRTRIAELEKALDDFVAAQNPETGAWRPLALNCAATKARAAIRARDSETEGM